jgi:hypothetical protein
LFSSSFSATTEPTYPVAPVKNTFIIFSFSIIFCLFSSFYRSSAPSVSRSTNFLIGGTTVSAAANAIGKASIHERNQSARKFLEKPRLISVSANDIKKDIVSATKKTNKTGAYFLVFERRIANFCLQKFRFSEFRLPR